MVSTDPIVWEVTCAVRQSLSDLRSYVIIGLIAWMSKQNLIKT